MSFTGDWSIDQASRGIEISNSGGLTFKRNNWQIRRRRISNDTYSSEIGTTSASISGVNGGVTETISAPSRTILKFDTSQNWINTTDRFVEAGYAINNRPVYVMAYGNSSKFSSSQSLVVYACAFAAGDLSCAWVLAQYNPLTIMSASFPTDIADLSFPTTLYAYYNSGFENDSNDRLTPSSGTFYGVSKFSGNSTASLATEQGAFICTLDDQIYSTPAVDWYEQEQTWVYRDEWVLV